MERLSSGFPAKPVATGVCALFSPQPLTVPGRLPSSTAAVGFAVKQGLPQPGKLELEEALLRQVGRPPSSPLSVLHSVVP